jgi:type III secretory pathway component EscV
VGFEQATIRVQREKEFGELKAAINRALTPERAGAFLKRLAKNGIRVRDFDAVLAARALEDAARAKADPERNAKQLYESLPVSDQAQMREFYLSKLESIDAALRQKFRKLYQYY